MSFTAVDPSTGHELAVLPETTVAEVAEMVAAARRALATEADWRTPLVRAGALTRLARGVEDDAETLAELECRDTGKPLSQARADVAATVRYLDYYAGSIERLEGRTIPLGDQRAPGRGHQLGHLLGRCFGDLGQLVAGRRIDRREAHRSRPPSTLNTAPVTALASSEAR